jgi:hypothetical protein
MSATKVFFYIPAECGANKRREITAAAKEKRYLETEKGGEKWFLMPTSADSRSGCC